MLGELFELFKTSKFESEKFPVCVCSFSLFPLTRERSPLGRRTLLSFSLSLAMSFRLCLASMCSLCSGESPLETPLETLH